MQPKLASIDISLAMRSTLLNEELNVCILICSYNNANTLDDIVQRCYPYATSILVINDGSTDSTAEILQQLNVQSFTFQSNMGKGNALRTGMQMAKEQGFDYVISLDSDGQHFPEDIPYLMEAIHLFPQQIIIGGRNMEQSTVPSKSSFGNRFSNFWFSFYTGIKVPDTQSGFRAYPLSILNKLQFHTNKYEFEVEILVRSAWQGYQVRSVPVRVYYPPGELRVSHFRPLRDFTRISVLNTLFFFRAFFLEIPKRSWQKLRRQGFKNSVYKALNDPAESPVRKASAIGFGIFMGIFPVWGYQLIIGWSVCHLLRLNKVLFTIAAHISVPPMIPFIVFGSYVAGRTFVTSENAASLENVKLSLKSVSINLMQYISGAILLSIIAGLMAFLFSWLFFKIIKKQ